jgi:5-methylcytosine-specific restriction enzyme A
MPIRDSLEDALALLTAERAPRPSKTDPLFIAVERSLPEAVSAIVADSSYLVEGSVGAGEWANVVWTSVFDRVITETARRGFYVVYLFETDGAGVYLSLNQATTEIREQVSGSKYLKVLVDTATRDVGLLAAEDTGGLVTGPIDLKAKTPLAKGYEAGNIFGKRYVAGAVPAEGDLETDLTHFLLLYQALVEGRATVTGSVPPNPEDPASGVEAKRMRWHQQVERSRSLAKKAKQVHGDRCQACEQRLGDIYGDDIGAGYIEAHHLSLFASLDGRPTELDPTADFAVLCPNCHAMVHRGPPFSVDEIRTRLGLTPLAPA